MSMSILLTLYLLPSVLVVLWAERRARLREGAAAAVRTTREAGTPAVHRLPRQAAIPAPAPAPAMTTETLGRLVDGLNAYFSGGDGAGDEARLAIESDGSIRARYRGLQLHSRYAALHARNGVVSGRQAGVQVFTARGEAVSSWMPYARTLDKDQVVRLDRLIRTLHVLNATHTPWNGRTLPLWLPVHPLHLRSLPGAFGAAFADILQRCGRTPADIVLEFTDADRLPAERLTAAIEGFRSRGFGIACLLRGDDPDWLRRILALAPDALRLGPAHLEAATGSHHERRRLAARITQARQAGVKVWLSGASTSDRIDLAMALGADGWLDEAVSADLALPDTGTAGLPLAAR